MGKKIQTIGRYVMDGVALGKGNFARVELATHGVTQIKVAIKVIDTRKIKEDYVKQNLHREAKILAALRHPNIIRLYETLKATTLYCLVTEYACGGELLAYIKSQKDSRLGESAARPYIRQLISALIYLHERGVVHRDLKMENILLDETKKNIKLVDFGLSNIYKETDPLQTHCGSPEYAAPELFCVGKTYGPEIDIWSLGIVTYAIIIGRLPFRMPFKDEYQRQHMLQQIQKGLSGFHDREMQHLTAECRHLLRHVIEPDPKTRLPLQEIQHHPWVSRNGKSPFYPYTPPPKDKTIRNQLYGELAFMMGMPRKVVMETVSESKADELSAMYNMLLDQKKKALGYFDIDHTSRRSGRDRDSRSRSRERDKVTGKSPGKGKGPGVKKVANKTAKAIAQTKAKGDRPSSMASEKQSRSSSEREAITGEKARILLEAEMVPDKHKLAPGSAQSTPQKAGATATANGPTRIPQRRGPLNMTLDLSKPPPLSPTTKISIADPNDPAAADPKSRTQPIRPTSLACQGGGTNPSHRLSKTQGAAQEATKATGAIPKQFGGSNFAGPIVAPKATPEDLTLTTFSSSSSEANLETMQQDMLNSSSKDKLLAEESQSLQPDSSAANNPYSQKQDAAGMEPAISDILKFKGSSKNFLLLKHLSDSEHFEDSGSQFSKSSQSGSHVLQGVFGSASQLHRRSESGSGSQTLHLKSGSGSGSGIISAKNDSEIFDSNTCLLPKSGSEPLAAVALEPIASKPTTSSLNPAKLISQKECHTCGLSPSSPTYLERHKKFCHTGAHALDIFVSPDENPSPTGPLWRPVMMHSTGSPHGSPAHGSPRGDSPVFKFPHVGAGTPRVPMQLPVATVEGYTDDEDDEDSDYCHKKPLLPRKGSPQMTRSASATGGVKWTSTNKSRNKSRERHKKYSADGVFTQVPDTSMRLEPVGAASSDSLSGQSTSSRQGDGSTEKLSTSSKAKIHPMDLGKDEDQPPSPQSLSKSRIPQPAGRLGRIQVFGLIQSGDRGHPGQEEEQPSSPPSPQHKQGKQKSLLRQYDQKNKQLSWRQGLSHLLRRTRSSSNTNNNVPVVGNKQSNGTTGNSVSKQGTTGNSVPKQNPAEREMYYAEMDAKWTAPPSPTHKCNSTSMQVTSSPVPSNTPSPVPQAYDINTSRSDTPTSPHRSKHRKVGWTGCKECAKSDQSSDEGAELTYCMERRVSGALKTPVASQSNDTRQLNRTTKV